MTNGRFGNANSRIRGWWIAVLTVLALLLTGAKGCRKKKEDGLHQAIGRGGEVYWYYAGENRWSGNHMWGGGLWCEATEPSGAPALFCDSDFPVLVDVKDAELTCSLRDQTHITISCNF